MDELKEFDVAQANREYFVDGSRGNDKGAGTIDAPWKTFAKASRTVQAGDAVYLRGGDYRGEGTIFLTRSGREGAPIRFLAYQQEVVTLEQIMVQESQWLVIRGLHIAGPKTLPAHWQEMPAVVVDDATVGAIDPAQEWKGGREAKAMRKYATFLTLKNQWSTGWSSGITLRHSSHILLQHNDITQHTAGINVVDESSQIFIVENRLHHLLIGFYSDHKASYAFSMQNSLLARNHFFQNLTVGIRLVNNARQNRVEANRVEYSGTSHIDTHSGSSHNQIDRKSVV